MDERCVLSLWGKTQDSTQDCAPLRRYHPLLYHLADAAAVTLELWTHHLSPATRFGISRSLTLDEDASGQWLTFLAALHDFGKCTPEFQCKASPLAARLVELGILSPGYRPSIHPVPHGLLGGCLIRNSLAQRFRIKDGLAVDWATLAGGHHGVFPAAGDVKGKFAEARTRFGYGPWDDLRSDIFLQFLTLLTPKCPSINRLDTATALTAAGLISVADWIASNQQYFPCAANLDDDSPLPGLAIHFNAAREQARDAMRELGWPVIPAPPTESSFSSLFPGKRARPSQEKIEQIANGIEQPAAVLIEAPMGEGKTEAALQLADRFAGRAGARGFYFALPTQATSNQLFSRIAEFLEHRYGAVPLNLAHGHASMTPAFLDLLERGRLYADLASVGDQRGDAVFAAAWFVQSKRALLAPFGVGTVDQALMASLITRHVFVRLFALAGKVLIVDEVHAYDAYMSTLLERLLEWLGALHCSVVLLSATLPLARRNALLEAWGRGAGGQAQFHIQIADQRYPRVSLIRADGVAITAGLPVSDCSRRALLLDWLPPSRLVPALLDLLDDGGCAAVICNTVSRAQATFDELRHALAALPLEDRPELELFHARFVLEDRQRIEQRVFSRFGPDSPARPHKAILVATQVVEQSLDLDFDLMISEMAPIDLLLQRSGRLHRHSRNSRPAKLAAPCLRIMEPDVDASGVPGFGGGTGKVYQPYILLRTWAALCERTSIQLPDDVEELIEAVYDSARECPGDEAFQSALSAAQATMTKDREKAKAEAESRYIHRPAAAMSLCSFTANPLEEDNPEVHAKLRAVTRLAEPSIDVVCLFGDLSQSFLDRDATHPVDLQSPPSPALVTALLHRSLSLSDWRLMPSLCREPPPRGWTNNPMLSFHRVLFFTRDGSATFAGFTLELDAEFGFRVTGKEGR
jgi:CRISPR-associated endonuclease/helicase Cas3